MSAWIPPMPHTRPELLQAAVHEAGHAVAHWHLDRTRYLSRPMPQLSHVAISRNGEPLFSGRGEKVDVPGICAAPPCINPKFPVDTRDPRDKRHRCYGGAMADIISTMAGPIAQAIHDGNPIRDPQEWRDRTAAAQGIDASDFEQVQERLCMLERLVGRRVSLCNDRAFALAERIVRDHQPHIRALALELVGHDVVSGPEVFALFDRIEATRKR